MIGLPASAGFRHSSTQPQRIRPSTVRRILRGSSARRARALPTANARLQATQDDRRGQRSRTAVPPEAPPRPDAAPYRQMPSSAAPPQRPLLSGPVLSGPVRRHPSDADAPLATVVDVIRDDTNPRNDLESTKWRGSAGPRRRPDSRGQPDHLPCRPGRPTAPTASPVNRSNRNRIIICLYLRTRPGRIASYPAGP